MADLTTQELTLTGKIAKFLFLLLAYLGVTSVIEVATEILLQAQAADTTTKPALKDVGDALMDSLSEGGAFIPNATEQTTFEKWVGIIKGGWDAVESGTGAIVSFFDALIAGHKAKVASEKEQAAKA